MASGAEESGDSKKGDGERRSSKIKNVLSKLKIGKKSSDKDAQENAQNEQQSEEKKDDMKELIERAQVISKDDRSNKVYTNYTPRGTFVDFIRSLPDNVQFDRSGWVSHDAWESQTLLIRGHRNFRQSSQRVVTHLLNALKVKAKKKREQYVRSAQWSFDSLTGSLHSHSSYEERKLFKYMERKYNCSLKLLLEDHHRIDRLERSVKGEIRQCLDNECTDETIVSSLRLAVEWDDLFVRHLGEEESVVIPMLLELTWEEYVRYYNARTYKQALGIDN